MKKFTVTTENALLLNDRTLKDNDGVEYCISTSTYKVNGVRVLSEMVVDAYVNDEWEHELSCAYHLGDVIEVDTDEWLRLI